MKNYIYCLFNSLSNRYESVMSFPSDAMAIHRLEKNIDVAEYQLCRIGAIDIESGVVDPENPIRLTWSDNTELPTKEV